MGRWIDCDDLLPRRAALLERGPSPGEPYATPYGLTESELTDPNGYCPCFARSGE